MGLGICAVFVTNNGLSDHIGIAQILPYLEGLARRGHRLECISVEAPANSAVYQATVLPRLSAAGIVHHPLQRSRDRRVQKLERLAMPWRIAARLRKTIADAGPDLLHCRSYMPLGAVLGESRRTATPFIFDARGFWIDQRIESGAWPQNSFYFRRMARYFRALESEAYSQARGIVVLTNDARCVIEKREDYGGAPISVIPCSVNQADFTIGGERRRKQREALGFAPDDIVLAFLGSSGPLYRLDALYRLASRLNGLGCSTKLLLVGSHDSTKLAQQAELLGCPLPKDSIRTATVPHNEVPLLLGAADFGVSFIIQSFSSLGVSATKTGEYLACGLPVISNQGIGDIEQIILPGETGWILQDFSEAQIAAAATRIAKGGFLPREAIRKRSAPMFDMTHALDRYDALYRQVAGASAVR